MGFYVVLCSIVLFRHTLPSTGSITSIKLSSGDRTEIVRHLQEKQRQDPDFSVIDIGTVAHPWTRNVLDAVVDLFATTFPECYPGPEWQPIATECCSTGKDAIAKNGMVCFDKDFTFERCCKAGRPRKLSRFDVDVTSEDAWKPVLDHVQQVGKFDYSVVSHILEDVTNPVTILKMLPLVAKRGFIAIPSKYRELKRGVEPPATEGANLYRGYIHHRWIFTVRNKELLAIPKINFIEGDPAFDFVGARDKNELRDLAVEWEGVIPYRVFNEGYLGPNPTDLAKMYHSVLGRTATDDVDAAAVVQITGFDLLSTEVDLDTPRQPKKVTNNDVSEKHHNMMWSLHWMDLRVNLLLDVGAFQGMFSAAMRNVFNCSSVLIEPNPRQDPSFAEGDVVLQIALGSEDKTTTLHTVKGARPEAMTGASLFRERTAFPTDTVEVPVRTLDGLADQYDWKFDFVKIDAEGAELSVIRGGMKTLRHAWGMLVEVSIIDYNEGAPRMLEVLAYLEHVVGFRVFQVVDCHRINHLWQLKCDVLLIRLDVLPRVVPTSWGPYCHLVPSLQCGTLGLQG